MKTCADCSVDISHRGTTSTRCLECAHLAANARRSAHAKKPHVRARDREIRLRLPRGTVAKAWEQQAGLCAACRRDLVSLANKETHADHDHKTGSFRGLLCVRCNMAIGYALDDPKILRALANYLDKQQ